MSEVSLILLEFALAAAVVVVAGTLLTRFADRISELTGWGRMFVGGLLLSGATSLPELMVGVKSLQIGAPDLAVGDLLGACLFNLLILSVLDFTYPSSFRGQSFSPRFLHHGLAAAMVIALAAIVGVAVASRIESSILGLSPFSWALAGLYLYGLRLIFLDGTHLAGAVEVVSAGVKGPPRMVKLARAFAGYLACAVVILFSAPYLVNAADQLARLSGMGHTFVGTTLLAVATTLPELVTTLTAFRLGAPDLALANILGSNMFNMVLFVPLDAIHPRGLYGSVSVHHVISAFGVITAMSVALMGQLFRKKERSRLTEPSSETVVVVILLVLYLLLTLKPNG